MCRGGVPIFAAGADVTTTTRLLARGNFSSSWRVSFVQDGHQSVMLPGRLRVTANCCQPWIYRLVTIASCVCGCARCYHDNAHLDVNTSPALVRQYDDRHSTHVNIELDYYLMIRRLTVARSSVIIALYCRDLTRETDSQRLLRYHWTPWEYGQLCRQTGKFC